MNWIRSECYLMIANFMFIKDSRCEIRLPSLLFQEEYNELKAHRVFHELQGAYIKHSNIL